MALGNSKLLLNPATGLKPRSARADGGAEASAVVRAVKWESNLWFDNFWGTLL